MLMLLNRAAGAGFFRPNENLRERMECLAVTARSDDVENVIMALEAVEEALAAGSSGPTDLPPAAEQRLAIR
jgi:hypothetical protein